MHAWWHFGICTFASCFALLNQMHFVLQHFLVGSLILCAVAVWFFKVCAS
jgi:uncharacterized membrane protein